MQRLGRWVVVAVTLAAAPALAQEVPSPAETRVPARVTVIVFDKQELTGEVQRPDLPILKARPRTRFAPVVQVRDNFRAELINSAAGL